MPLAIVTPPAPNVGLGPLRIEEEIGSGAIASVVRVVDEASGTTYAAKILHERHRRDPAASRRFVREAELAQSLRHENVVAVYGAVTLEERPALLMELVEGPSLAEHIAREGTLGESQVVALALGIARGLASAHGAGVIHRDLKPANILLAPKVDGEGGPDLVPKIADFGMARASSFASADKGALTVLGTPQYMAPECLDPLAVDPRTDLYALGCIVYEMVTGAPPFGGATPFAVLDQHRNASPPPLPEGISASLGKLVARLLAKTAGDRPQSAAAVVAALEASGEPSTAVAIASPERVADGRCARCDAVIFREARVCFRCGLVQAVFEEGDCSVFVTGPGKLSHKLDTMLRDRLLRWLEANAAVGISPGRLATKIPRVPFLLISRVSRTCAETLRASLQHIGIEAAWERGGRLSHHGIIRNTNRQAGRTLAICLGILGAPMMIHPAMVVFTLPVLLACVPVVYGITVGNVSQPMAVRAPTIAGPLPAAVEARLAALHQVVPKIAERRHRDALRVVVHRVIELCRDTPAELHAEVGAEMDHAIALAAGASLRMDQLDHDMGAAQFDPADPAARALMHERDLWSARLLELTATLDALAVRRAAAQVDHSSRAELDALRATVDALEEVQRS